MSEFSTMLFSTILGGVSGFGVSYFFWKKEIQYKRPMLFLEKRDLPAETLNNKNIKLILVNHGTSFASHVGIFIHDPSIKYKYHFGFDVPIPPKDESFTVLRGEIIDDRYGYGLKEEDNKKYKKKKNGDEAHEYYVYVSYSDPVGNKYNDNWTIRHIRDQKDLQIIRFGAPKRKDPDMGKERNELKKYIFRVRGREHS